MTQMWLLLSLIALKHTQVTTLNTHNSLRSITAAPSACANIMVDAPQSLQHGEMGRAMFSAGGRTLALPVLFALFQRPPGRAGRETALHLRVQSPLHLSWAWRLDSHRPYTAPLLAHRMADGVWMLLFQHWVRFSRVCSALLHQLWSDASSFFGSFGALDSCVLSDPFRWWLATSCKEWPASGGGSWSIQVGGAALCRPVPVLHMRIYLLSPISYLISH
jgi:hypothetical protein